MSDAESIDLSGRWHGIYNYPDGSPPVAFEAELAETAGALIGEIREVDDHIALQPVALEATIQGQRDGTRVRFTKFYEANIEEHDFDTVLYEGELRDEGHEIEGEWHIPGVWSGSFLMVRSRGAAAEAEREAGETVR